MRAYIGCMACYNVGALVGQWVDAIDAGDVTIADLHDGKACKHGNEELWCYDTESLGVGECSPGEAAERARVLASVDDPDALLAYVSDIGCDLAHAKRKFEEAYEGTHDSGADFAKQLADDLGGMPRSLRWPFTCIDWQAAWRELERGGGFFAVPCESGGVYVFRSY